MMYRLASVVYLIVSIVVTGIAMVAALVLGYDDAQAMIVVSVAGFVVAVPITYVVALHLFKLAND
jgi:hypothetical protein